MFVINNVNFPILIDNLMSEWGHVQYPQLSVLLVLLKHLREVYKNNHWISKGDSFYGDHLLFERFYDNVVKEIDVVAEKAIGLGTSANVNAQLISQQVLKLIECCNVNSTIPQSTELAKRSLTAEINFSNACELLIESLKQSALLTRGLDNMIAGIQDLHEGHVYLLKQRCTPAIDIS